MDYLVSVPEKGIEIPAETFNEAKSEAARQYKEHGDAIIDQYDDQQELTGTYWEYRDGKLVKFL